MEFLANRTGTSGFIKSWSWRLPIKFIFAATIFVLANTAWCDFLTQVQVVHGSDSDVEGLSRAVALVISPDGKYVYVASGNGIVVFSRNRNSGTLSFVEFETHRIGADDGLLNPEHLSVSPDGKHVYVATGGRGSLASFERSQATGEISFAGFYDKLLYDNSVYDASSSAVTPDGNYVIVTLLINEVLAIYSRDKSTGLLNLEENYRDLFGPFNFSDPTDVAVGPEGKSLYITNSQDDELLVLEFDGETASADFIESQNDGENGVDGLNGANSVALSRDGEYVYVASPIDFAISVFDRNLGNGALSFLEIQRDGINGVEGLDGAFHVTVSPDSQYVYVLGRNDDALAVFKRNRSSGKLSFIEAQIESENDVEGLEDATQSAVSPDGEFIYVTANKFDDATVSVFRTSGGTTPPPGKFQINAGLNGSWFYPGTDGQGFFIDVFPDAGQMFVAWFTFDTEQPDESVSANLGHPGQRWLTAQGEYADNQAVLDVYISGGGLFDMRPPIPTVEKDGTLTIEFTDCMTGTVTYDIPSIGQQGIVPIERILSDNVPLCESLDGLTQALQ